jgi:hypothetical protein
LYNSTISKLTHATSVGDFNIQWRQYRFRDTKRQFRQDEFLPKAQNSQLSLTAEYDAQNSTIDL